VRKALCLKLFNMVKCIKKINILEAVQYDGSACSYDRIEKFVAHHARTKYAVCGVILQGRIPGTSYLGMQLNEINTGSDFGLVRKLKMFDWLVFNKDKQDFEIYDENDFASFFVML